MKKIILYAVCVAIIASSLFCGAVIGTVAQSDKILYTDFSAELVEDTHVGSGNGDHTISLYSGYTVSNFKQTDGVLSMKVQNGNYVRFTNTLNLKSADIEYMVVKMKGTNDWGTGLTGNALKFWFGSCGNQGSGIYMTSDQLTADYSEVVLAIPDGYFDSLSSTDLFITSERGATFDVSIDEIYFCKKYPIEEPEEVFEKQIYSDFNQELILNTPVVSDGADGRIILFHAELCTPTVSDGALKVLYNTPDSYLRFTNTLALTDSTKTSLYKYIVLRMKGSATTKDGAPYTSGRMLNIIIGNWGNEANPIVMDASLLSSEEYVDVALELNDINFAATASGYESGLIIKTGGNLDIELDIDEIYFCDTLPPTDNEEDDSENKPGGSEQQTDFIYSEFTDALVEGTAVSNGADGTITLFATENATQSVAGGKLNLNIKADGYIRFTSSLALSDDCKTTKYKYMVIKIKGSATKSDGSVVTGNLLNVIFGSWGNEGNPVVISGSQINSDAFTTLVLELNDNNFANTHADYASGLIFRNAGIFESNVEIDSIYFTDVKPTSAPITPLTPSITETKDKVYYSNFDTALVEGTAVSNGDDGTITLFNMIDCTQSVSGGVLNLKLSGEGAYARFSSSLVLTEDCKTSKYKYMVVKIKGSAVNTAGSTVTGNVLKLIMGSWGNEANPLLIGASDLTTGYNTIVFELQDKNFAATHIDYVGGLIIQNGGNFKTDITIDEIYFTDIKPAGVAVSGDGNSSNSGEASSGSTSDDTEGEENVVGSVDNSDNSDTTPSKDTDNEQVANAAFSDGNPVIGLIFIIVFAVVIIAFCIAGTLIIFRGRRLKIA